MSKRYFGQPALLVFIVLTGCGVTGPRRETVKGPPKSDRGKGLDKQLAMGNAASRDAPLADPSTMIPPPPSMIFPDIPGSPGPENAYVSAPTTQPGSENNPIVQTSASRQPIERVRAASESNLQAAKRLHTLAAERYAKLQGFESRITRREMIGTKSMPEEVLLYRLRKSPLSMHIKWVGKEAQGRELVYVEGKYENKVQILTGREPELLRPSGIKVARLPTDKDVTSKSRFDMREGGMGMSLDWFGKVVAVMEKDPTQANRLRYIGSKQRLERATGLEAVEETIPANWEPLLPKGGSRTTYFDSDTNSPSYGLPVLIITLNDHGREVEYYWFDQFRPIQATDADFDTAKLWKK